jgi:hypothetical protein
VKGVKKEKMECAIYVKKMGILERVCGRETENTWLHSETLVAYFCTSKN